MTLDRPILFAAAVDADASKAFYGHVLGFTLQADTPFALVYDAAGHRLHVQKVRAWEAPPATVLGWVVDDLRATLATLRDRGATFERFEGLPQDDDGVWTTPDGAAVAWMRDPAGNLLSLTQMPG